MITLSTLKTYNTKLALSGYLLEATSPRGGEAEVGYNGLIATICVFDIIISLLAKYVIFRDEYSAECSTNDLPPVTDKKTMLIP
ncbi:hypothetical protein [Bartonella acomydis]|uniref:Phage related protein n=1 Tax=Bartonella acomydis TaxID=686234 RepID=A0ABP9MID8_9HYPH